MNTKTILLVEDDAAIRMVLNQTLTRAGYEVRPTGNLSTLWNWVTRGEGDLLITDVALPDGNAFELMPKIKSSRKNLPIIVMSAQNTFMTAIRASEAGAYDYLPKPFDINEMLAVVSRALNDAVKPPKREEGLEQEPDEKMPLVGRSPAMQEIYRSLARLMQTDLTVMIAGESGTGKELVAKALHQFGKRAHGPFVAINMAAIPKDLIEAELFGHEKGAFTGATARQSGRFEQADGGTLFLDEIGDMPMDAQTRLLRVLQEGEFHMVGGIKAIKTNVRIVAATHQDLPELIKQGRFREDLFYRLNVVPLRLPPLRERVQDIDDLVTHFLQNNKNNGLSAKSISMDAIELLQKYSWPGNIRELENLIHRLCALHADETISSSNVEIELAQITQTISGTKAHRVDLSVAIEQYLADIFVAHEPGLPPSGMYNNLLEQLEAPLISMALNACNGNQIKTAKLLGLNRNTLRKKINAHKIEIIRHTKSNA
ncbi:MAG: nitrogen regulation protein NR(I) [Devosiaceae bacterium]|nr:nitrogen regulation protein NR(I) [Devosiaceae bacterium]